MNKWIGIVTAVFTLTASAMAGSLYECSFDDLSNGPVDGQQGWDVFDKVRDSSSCSVVSGVGVTEADSDKALVVKACGDSIRCVTDDSVRWLRGQTAAVEFDFRVVAPAEAHFDNRPLMVCLIGNKVLGENARWGISFNVTTNGDWMVSAALPDEVSSTVPSDRLAISKGDASILSDWLHCSVKVRKLSSADSFESSVVIRDRTGNTLVELQCSDRDKGEATRAMWNLSRLHAGFLAATDLGGLACIDNFSIAIVP